MTTTDFGTWTAPFASVTICLIIPGFMLFLGNRDLYPIMQREPVWAAISNLSFQIVIWFYLYEKRYPELPLWWNMIYSQLGWGIMLAMYLVRTWKLYIDCGLAHERVQNKFGWFVAHRHYRQPKSLAKFVGILLAFHLIMVPIQFLLGQNPNISGRDADKSYGTALLFGVIVLAYFISYGVFGCKLRGLRDGFYIKTELSFVGVGGILMVLLWLAYAALNLHCLFPSCSVLIVWFVANWMYFWSILLPLFIASRDPRFGVLRCFQRRKERHTTTASKNESSRGSTREEVSDFHESAIDVKPESAPAEKAPLSAEKLARLKHVTLTKFLTFSPGREAFRTFTVLEFSVENLLFVEAVKELGSRPHTPAEARALYDRFVVDSAPNQVNLPSIVVQRIKARVAEEDCDSKVFDEAVEHIFKVMQRDTYKRFQKTPEWAQCVRVFEAEAKRGKSAEVPATNVQQKPQQPQPEVAVASPTLSVCEPDEVASHELDNKDLPDSPTPTPSPQPTEDLLV